MEKTNFNKPYFDSNNVLHYWHKGTLKTFDCSNKHVLSLKKMSKEKNGIGSTEYDGNFYKDWLPDEVVKALLDTGEFFWYKGDKLTDYFSDVYHQCWSVTGSDYHICNVASNPCLGYIRPKKESRDGETECPRCAAIWAIYNNHKHKPLKWKFNDWWRTLKARFEAPIFNAKIQLQVFKEIHSKDGKDSLKEYVSDVLSGKVLYIVKWRKQWLKSILRKNKFSHFQTYNTYGNKDGWIVWNNSCKEDIELLLDETSTDGYSNRVKTVT